MEQLIIDLADLVRDTNDDEGFDRKEFQNEARRLIETFLSETKQKAHTG